MFTKVQRSGVPCCHLRVPLKSWCARELPECHPRSHPSWLLPGADPLPFQIPIQESLIEFVDGGISKLATEAFQGR